jgi:hypothetical protein
MRRQRPVIVARASGRFSHNETLLHWVWRNAARIFLVGPHGRAHRSGANTGSAAIGSITDNRGLCRQRARRGEISPLHKRVIALIAAGYFLERIVDQRPNPAKVIQSCDVLVEPDGLMYMTDTTTGLYLLEYEGKL